MKSTFQIQTLLEEDLPFISEITPLEWNDISVVFQTHMNGDYFFPIKIVIENQLVAVGELIINNNIGWLGNIVVRESFRNQGFGKKVTQELMKMAYEKKCESIYLLATPLGEYVYKKLDFQVNGQYLFLKNITKAQNGQNNNNIITYNEKYRSEVLELDKEAIGEDRGKVLVRFLKDGWVYKKPNETQICGFFLPSLGDGVIICNNEIAGFELIEKREAMGKDYIAVPEENESAIIYLKEKGYTHYRSATFMFLGKMKNWNPEMIYSRIGGYIG